MENLGVCTLRLVAGLAWEKKSIIGNIYSPAPDWPPARASVPPPCMLTHDLIMMQCGGLPKATAKLPGEKIKPENKAESF